MRSVETTPVERLDAAAVVRRIVEALDRGDAAALLLQVAFDEDHAALAARSGCSVGAMRVASHRARRRLQDAARRVSNDDRGDSAPETIEGTFAICSQAIATRDATPWYAALEAAPTVAAMRSCAAPLVRVAFVQRGGRHVLAFCQGDRPICPLPIGVGVMETCTLR